MNVAGFMKTDGGAVADEWNAEWEARADVACLEAVVLECSRTLPDSLGVAVAILNKVKTEYVLCVFVYVWNNKQM